MNILVVAGGTLGHIRPALVYINEVKKKDSKTNIYFIATTKDKKYEILKNNNITNIYYLNAFGMNTNIKKCFINLKCLSKINKIIKELKINTVIGFGGYISGIALLAGKLNKCKTYIHEQNSIMGRANRLICKHVDKIYLSYPLKNNQYQNSLIVGNLVYLDASNLKTKIYKEKNTILFTSGSLGSKIVNDIAVKFIRSEYFEQYKHYKVIIITGDAYYLDIKNKLINHPQIEIIPFTNDLVTYLCKSEIVISRAGASTLFEIMASLSVPLIIPSINVTENHQYYNAKYFTDLKCGRLLEEKDLNIDTFLKELKLIKDNYLTYKENIKNLDIKSSFDEMIKETTYER